MPGRVQISQAHQRRRRPIGAAVRGRQATQITDEALRFCIAFQNDHGVTKNFVQALAEQNLLVEVQYAASMTVGKYISLKGFQDAGRFQNLPDPVIADWHRKGRLGLVQFHLASQANWRDLTARQGAVLAPAA
jgi:SapC